MSHGPRTSQTWLDQYYLSIKQLVVSSGGSPGLYDNGDLPFYGSAAVMACQQQAFGRFWTPGVNGNTGDVWASNGRGWTPSAAPNANAFGPPRPDAGVVPVTNGGYGPGPGFSNGNFFRYIRDSIQASLNHAKTLAGRCAQDGCCKCTNIKVKFQLDDYTRGAHGNTAKGDYIHGMRTGGAQNWINNQGGALDVSGAEPDPPTKSSLPQQPGDSPLPFGEREWTFPVQRK